jgi:hypothetical protein
VVFPLLVLLLAQDASCTGDGAGQVANAMRLGESFELAAAADAYAAAAAAGCPGVLPAVMYLRGLVAARAAEQQFGATAALQSLKDFITRLEPYAASDPVARAMQAVLRAAMPAAQHERPEMELLIDDMLHREALQLEAGLPGLPIVSAHEAAGLFWLYLHAYDEAARAFDVAAARIGNTPYVMLGRARAAAGRRNTALACSAYAQLIDWWSSRTSTPTEITEARDFVRQPACAASSKRPGSR